MITIDTILEMQSAATASRRDGKRIGLVPTMGALHEGHLSLVREARKLCDVLVVSIFVNPLQFAPTEDLARYPRDLERDLELCRTEGVDIAFCPTTEAMYRADRSVHVDETSLSTELCGRTRPGHFRGVLTVVAKLFNIVLPDVVAFGQKDAQQVRLIQRMVRDLNFPLTILVCPIVREADGLAMSSRNRYLSPAERQIALRLYGALCLAEKLWEDGVREVDRLRGAMIAHIQGGEGEAELDYIAIVDGNSLCPAGDSTGPLLVAVAARVGRTRLIDNVVLGG